jgi:CheY-like chemotaxis protein
MLGDCTQVHQVLSNLMLNGVQAMESGGVLRVALETRSFGARALATVGSVAAADYIVLTVSDDGAGIPPALLGRIFDPFFTTKEVGVGTGLGLSMVHAIVTELGGAISVASTEGKGSTFTVYLPRFGEVAAGGCTSTQPAAPRGQGQRVLVVDDEEALARLAGAMLDDLGYAHATFTSPAQALAAFSAAPERYDAVITDERMPGMTGSELIRALRGVRAGIPIVLASGYAGAALAHQGGAGGVLRKPYTMMELAQVLAQIFGPHVN